MADINQQDKTEFRIHQEGSRVSKRENRLECCHQEIRTKLRERERSGDVKNMVEKGT